MPNDGKNQQKQGQQNQGQQKVHQVQNPNTGEQRPVTQEQWKNRKDDPTLQGFERVDDNAAPTEDHLVDAGVVVEED